MPYEETLKKKEVQTRKEINWKNSSPESADELPKDAFFVSKRGTFEWKNKPMNNNT